MPIDSCSHSGRRDACKRGSQQNHQGSEPYEKSAGCGFGAGNTVAAMVERERRAATRRLARSETQGIQNSALVCAAVARYHPNVVCGCRCRLLFCSTATLHAAAAAPSAAQDLSPQSSPMPACLSTPIEPTIFSARLVSKWLSRDGIHQDEGAAATGQSLARAASMRSCAFFGAFADLTASRLLDGSPTVTTAAMPMAQCGEHLMT